MTKTAEKLMGGLYKTIKLTIDGEELPFKVRKLSVLELSNKLSLINSIVAGNGAKAKKDEGGEEINPATLECIVWAIETACVDPRFSREEEEGKVPLATLPIEKSVELATAIFEHCGLIEGMEEAKQVGPFSEGAEAEASSRST
jgi:hypothetical protein